jgi:hypothetical protein
MGAKCKHLNFSLGEHVQGVTNFAFIDGKPPEDGIGWHSDLTPEGTLTVTCDDCGWSHDYKRMAGRPKWVQDAWDALMYVQRKQ